MGATQQLILAALRPWTPALLPTPPSLWFNDSSAVTDAGSGACSQWNDISGNSFHFVQNTGGSRPLIVSGGLNGRRTIRFDGSDDMLYNNGTPARDLYNNVGNLVDVVVYKKTATDAGVGKIITFASTNAGLSRFSTAASGAGGSEANKTRGIVRRGDADSAATLTQGTSLGTAWQMAMFRVEFNNRDGYLDINGSNDQTNTTFTTVGSNTSATTPSFAVSMGGSPNGAGGTPTTTNAADIEIAERFMIRAALTQGNVDRIFGYLAWHWGLVADLPALHPYKNAPPYA